MGLVGLLGLLELLGLVGLQGLRRRQKRGRAQPEDHQGRNAVGWREDHRACSLMAAEVSLHLLVVVLGALLLVARPLAAWEWVVQWRAVIQQQPVALRCWAPLRLPTVVGARHAGSVVRGPVQLP